MKFENKDKSFELRFTEAQFAALQKEATERGFGSISEYIRYLLFVVIPAVERMYRIYEGVK